MEKLLKTFLYLIPMAYKKNYFIFNNISFKFIKKLFKNKCIDDNLSTLKLSQL